MAGCWQCGWAGEGPADGNSALGAGEAMFPLGGAMEPCPCCTGGGDHEGVLDSLFGGWLTS